MTLVDRVPAPSTVPDDGGTPARRAVIRWAWRLFRRQWRSQALILALLTLAVAAAVGGTAAAYSIAPAAGNAEFGSANHALRFEDPHPESLGNDVAAAEAWFGTIDVIDRQFQEVPGLFDPVEFRAQSPDGPFSSPMLALLEGGYPTTLGEVAVTDGVAALLNVEIGEMLQVDLGTWTVVGIVENPSDLNDEFALLAQSSEGTPESVTILVGGTDDTLQSFRPPSGASPVAVARPGNEGAVAAVGVLVAATLMLVLVSLVAAAGFMVTAQRRLRQLAMLAAIGGTEKHLRLVMVANGVAVGIFAAVAGATIGLLGWILVVPLLEATVAHRIERFGVPWWLIGTSMLLAIMTATAAAWWPARAVARIPIVSALSGRPTRPLPARRSSAIAGPALVVGVGCLALASNSLPAWVDVLLQITGIAALIVGVLAVGPLALRALAGVARRSSVAVRLTTRDLVRFQARSASALAAITLALGIAVAIVISTSSALYASGAEGNLAATQMMVRIGEIPARGDVAPIPERTPAEVARLDTIVDEMAASLEEATVTPIDVAVDPSFEGIDGLAAVVLTEEVEPGLNRILTLLYIATPELLAHYDVELDTIGSATEVLTVETGELFFEPMSPELVSNHHQLDPGYSSLPGSFITLDAHSNRGWDRARAAWLIESNTPIDTQQFDEIQKLAAAVGVTVEARDSQADLAALRMGATAAGILVGLGILAMTVGLIRSETEGDLRTLTATGATSRIRRTLTATAAGSLALLGALLGTTVAYLGSVAGYRSDLSLTPVPFPYLLAIIVGLPLISAGGGWLFAGKEPTSLSRQPIE